MAAGFSLQVYPFVYAARYRDGGWDEEMQEKPHRSAQEEAAMAPEELTDLLASRNSFPDFPLINYTGQYGMGCFEGLKAYPQPDGSLKVFRPEANADRFYKSMEGLKMPPFPRGTFVDAVLATVGNNAAAGFRPEYDPAWEKNNFIEATAVYLRPFTWSEGGIGLNLSHSPSVIIAATPVGSYFDPDANSKALVTDRIRATSRGTGWIKCNANYVIPTLAKKEAIARGYMEAVFLDAREQRFIEEGSSCNFFALLKDGTLVTPAVEDRILNGINRQSVLTLAKDMGVKTEERQLDVAEVLDKGVECFVTGTAAGVSYLESLTHGSRTTVFGNGKIGELTLALLTRLKGIQYGKEPDKYGWMVDVPVRS